VTPEQFAELGVLFEAALALPEDERDRFLRSRCDDAEVLQKLGAMLAHDDAGGALETPALGGGFHVGSAAAPDDRLIEEFESQGRFRVHSVVGEGGFGTVYAAEQLRPVRRVVALKVVKLGMDTRRVVARFESERQTLAMMDHPAIARMFDAGALPSGRPYFVMEFVTGEPITRFCTDKAMPVRDRLRLFVRVCNAVQHAHQKGIIHRDLKPSNVLVSETDGRPLPKVIDFGIARAISDDAGGGGAAMTEMGQPIGTIGYMSPEQAAGERDIDTRTDIYSLGALLYELLTGTTPLDQQSRKATSQAELLRLIRVSEPERPSHRVASTSSGAGGGAGAAASPAASVSELRGDLDWILVTALEPTRDRRYATVSALADDIERHLADEPISAHPPTAGYRLQKFARRNKVGLGIVGLILIALVGTSAGLVRSVRAESRARSEAMVANEINRFLNDDLLAAAAPEQMGSDVRVRDVLDAAAERIEGRFDQLPEVEAALRLTLGRTYSSLAVFDLAQQQLEMARALNASRYGGLDARTLQCLHELGQLAMYTERYEESEAILREAIAGRERTLGRDHPDTIKSVYWLGVVIGEQGRYQETETILLDALDRATSVLGTQHEERLVYLRGLAVLYLSTGELDKARPLFEDAYASMRETLGVNHPSTLLAMQDLSSVLISHGEADRARVLLEEALAASRVVRGADHPATLMTMGLLGGVYAEAGETGAAIELLTAAVDQARAAMPPGHSVIMRLLVTLAETYDIAGEHALAEPLIEEAVRGICEQLGVDHPYSQQMLGKLAAHYRASGMTEEDAAIKAGLR